MELYSLSDSAVAALLAIFASIVTVSVIAFVGLLGLMQGVRQSRLWKRSLKGLFSIALLEVVVFFSYSPIAKMIEQAKVGWYTHQITEPTVIDGVQFPAGSTVVQSPQWPHEVLHGTVPPGSPVLGSVITGDFELTADWSSKPPKYSLSRATLATPSTFDGFDCAPGKFTHYTDVQSNDYTSLIDCTLASSYGSGDIVLPPGSHIKAFDSDKFHLGKVSGELPGEWTTFRVRCAKGAFDVDEQHRFSCTSATRQTIAGYDLAPDHKITVYRTREGEFSIREGVLASVLDVDGLRIPAGTWMYQADADFPNLAERVRKQQFEENQYLEFDVPAGTKLDATGTILVGGAIKILMDSHVAEISVAPKPEDSDQSSRDYTTTWGAK